MSILNRIRYLTQRDKRQEMLNRYGFYETVETQRGILTCTNDIFGVGSYRGRYTTFHVHTMLDCPFLIKPRYEDQTEYSCQLILKHEIYNMSLEDIINLLLPTPSLVSHYYCKCMEWTGHLWQE